MKWIVGGGLGSLALLLLGIEILAPEMFHGAKRAPDTQALSNARQIGLALFDFESDYSRFPDASTIPALKAATGSTWEFKTRTSNDVFKQLIAAGITCSEELFYAKSYGAKRPDNVISSEAVTLEPGECGFAYIAGATSESHPARPVLVTPLIPETLKADPLPFEGRAIVLMSDETAVSYPIAPDGTIIAPGGKDLFDPSQPYWEGTLPDVKWPDLPVPPTTHASGWLVWVVPSALIAAVAILITSIVRSRRLLLKKPLSAVVKER